MKMESIVDHVDHLTSILENMPTKSHISDMASACNLLTEAEKLIRKRKQQLTTAIMENAKQLPLA